MTGVSSHPWSTQKATGANPSFSVRELPHSGLPLSFASTLAGPGTELKPNGIASDCPERILMGNNSKEGIYTVEQSQMRIQISQERLYE